MRLPKNKMSISSSWDRRSMSAGFRERHWPGTALAVACFLLLSTAPALTQEATLIEDGKPLAALVLLADAADDEILAARELQAHLQKMAGALLGISTGTASSGVQGIHIGAALDPAAAARLRVRSADPAAFLITVGPERVSLVGNSPEGTLFAAYELLEQLGCRWYLPGELGTVIPRQKTVSLPVGETFQTPSFPHRHLQNVSGPHPWSRRARLGGLYFPGSHGIPLLPKAEFAEEPELFALVDGERKKAQLCVSNPEVVRRAGAAALDYFDRNPESPWVGMGPNDGGGFCECEPCRQLDPGWIDPISGRPVHTDRYVWLFNQIVEKVHEKYPGKKIAFYVYTGLKFPPKEQPVSPFLVPAFAPITHDRIHGMSNPLSPDRSLYRAVISQWCALVPEAYERGYYFNLACPGLPFSKIHAVRDETPVAHELGVKGWRVESMPSWVANGPTLYVATRLMWDVDTDVDALLADFYEKFFGPAAAPMGRYLNAADAWFRDTECITGSSFCMPHVFTSERMERCDQWFVEAAKRAAGDPTCTERVRIFRLNHERLTAFLDMLVARNGFDFAGAHQSLDQLYALTEEATTYRLYPAAGDTASFEAYPVYPRSASYIDRFWAPCTQAGYVRTAAHGDLVATAPDEWDFLIDPSDAGDMLAWNRDGPIGGNWQKLRTRSASWSDQGLHYYKGLAWYRTTVEIPARFRDRRLFLWFGGVDEKAEVWLNGHRVGESEVGSFRPFDLEVTAAARFDSPNHLAVRITNRQLNELGTGGITAPVMVWSPRSPEDLQAIFPEPEE